MAKLSISIGTQDLAWLRRRARRMHGGNLSAAIADATQMLRHNEALGELLDRMGAPKLSRRESDAVAAEIDGVARGPVKRKRRAA